ncbi:MAG: flavin reductase family protein [Bacillota bacterium]
MTKRLLQPAPTLYPVPAALISVAGEPRPNLITLAWVGVVCSDPPVLSIGVRPTRYSHGLIEAAGDFAVNLPTAAMARAVDLCGNLSGRDEDKFARAGLTAYPATRISSPLVAECPVNVECRLRQAIPLGSHTLFLGEVVAVHAEESVLGANGRPDSAKLEALAYIAGQYWRQGQPLGGSGFSLKD